MPTSLELSTADVRVIAPRDQGGGFGVKEPFYREHVVVCHLARKLGRPVRWIETREEHLMTVSQERDQIHDLEIAADREGHILALRNRGIGDVGDGRQGVYWGFVMPSLGSVMLPNAYAIGRADIKLRCAVTNKACLSPSRSFGAHCPRASRWSAASTCWRAGSASKRPCSSAGTWSPISPSPA